MKRYMNTALLYAIFAMAGGVFYREFTRFHSFTAKTALSVVHTHYFLLGMVFFLLLLLLEKNFSFTNPKTGHLLAVYHIGLNLTAVMLAVRGVIQVTGTPLSSGMNAAVSGIAGIGHILLGISLVLLLLQIRRSVLGRPSLSEDNQRHQTAALRYPEQQRKRVYGDRITTIHSFFKGQVH